MKSKKAGVPLFAMMMVLIFIGLMVTALIILTTKTNKIAPKALGQRAFELFEAYSEGEKAMYYIDRAAEIAAEQAVYDLAANGGKESQGDAGYPIWLHDDEEMYPSETELINNYKDYLNSRIYIYSASYPAKNVIMPYTFSISLDDESNIFGNALSDLVIGTADYQTVFGIANYAGQYWPLPKQPDLAVPVKGQPGAAAKYFMAPRSSDKCPGGRRYHVGIDLIVPAGSPIIATEDGTVVNYYHFYEGTYALLIETDNGYVINYGEIAPNPPVKVGDRIYAGQHIANVGLMDTGSHMLHFEIYQAGTQANIAWCRVHPQPVAILDPTPYLLDLKQTEPPQQTTVI